MRSRTGLGSELSRGPERVEMSKGTDVLRQPLPLVAQPSEFPQFDLAQRRPTAEEKRHSLITLMSRDAKLVDVQL